jgi:hypothetical protein
MLTCLRFLTCLAAWSLCFPYPSFSFDSPLSDTAVRDAYFLGQHHDQILTDFLTPYTKSLPPPASGPYIYAVSFMTPFALMVQYSSRQSNYSAQQAQIDHQTAPEMVSIRVEISLTQSYGPFLTKPIGSRSAPPFGIQLRSADFWRDVKFRIFDGKEEIRTNDINGQPHYFCSDDGGCTLSGATVSLQFAASAFTSDCATIEMTPPEGDPVAVDFDLYSMK